PAALAVRYRFRFAQGPMACSLVSGDTSIRPLYAAVATTEMAHGAVSAAAVAAGMGMSLLIMVAALPKTRSGSIDDRTALLGATSPHRAAAAVGRSDGQ